MNEHRLQMLIFFFARGTWHYLKLISIINSVVIVKGFIEEWLKLNDKALHTILNVESSFAKLLMCM